ncbi:putative leader peptide [Streptomyces collinus]|uniref:putative leader peptide n=1 Tax=Streptomyces collinus TaxID=42684 RepID=UPI003429D062
MRCARPPYEHPLGLGAGFCHDPYQPGRKARDHGGGRVMRSLGRTLLLLLPRLTSRRHIDLGRTSSAICRSV